MQSIQEEQVKDTIPSGLEFYFDENILLKERAVIDGKEPVGYTKQDGYDGVKPIYLDKNKSYEERLLELYDYRTDAPEGFSVTPIDEQVNKLFTDTRQYYDKNGDLIRVPDNEWKVTHQFKRFIDPASKIVPGWQGESETKREFEFADQLAELGLSKDNQSRISQAMDKTTFSDYMLSEAPDEGQVPFLMQIQNLVGNIYDFVPDMAGLGIWAYKGMTKEKPDIKGLEEGKLTYQEFEAQEHVAAMNNLDTTRYFEDLRSKTPFIAPYKNLYKTMVFNATQDEFGEGIALTDEQVDLMFKEGPVTYQVARVATEALPYVLAIEGVIIKGFGLIKGTKAYDDALDYVAKNTHKHGSPYEAIVAYMERDAIKKMWIDTPRGNKFMNNVVKRFDKKNVQLTKLEKSSIEKSIKEIDDQIVQANKSNDILKIRELSLQKDSLLATHTGLKINYLNNYTKALVRNEAYASAIGGTLFSLTGSDGLAIGGELAGAILEPTIHKNVKNAASSVTFRVAQLIDGLNSWSMLPDGAKVWSDKNLKAKFFTGNVDDLMIRDKKSGELRALKTKEISQLRGFAELFEFLPVNDRVRILARMEKSQEIMETLRKSLPEEQHQNLNMTIAEMTGLSVLNAIDELSAINMKITNIRPNDLIEANQNILSSVALLDSIDRRIQEMLGSTQNPSSELFEFGNNIEKSLQLLRNDLSDRKNAYEQIIGIYADSLNGLNITDNVDLKNIKFLDSIKLLEDLSKNGASDQLKIIAEEELGKVTEKILAHWSNVAKDLNGIAGNYTKGYTVQEYFASDFYDTMKLVFDNNVKKAYKALGDKTQGQTIDVTDAYRELSTLIDRNRGDTIGSLGNKLPPGLFNEKMIRVLEDGANSSLNRFLLDNDNGRAAFAGFIDEAPEKSESMVQAINLLVEKSGQFTTGDINIIFGGLAETIVQTGKYANRSPGDITKLDMYDILRESGMDISINLTVPQSLNLRSSLSTLKSRAFQSDQKVQSLNYDNMLRVIEKSITDSLNTKEKVDLYNTAINTAADFHKRFDSDNLLSSWGEMSTNPIVYRETENLQDGTNISKKNKPDNQNSKKVLNDLKIDENILVPNYVHKLSRGEFIPWNKVLNDPVYAEKWMREVIEPMVGRPVNANDIILPNQTHIIDMADKEVATRAKVFKKLLEQELGSYLSLTESGRMIMNPADVSEFLLLARQKKIELPKNIQYRNDIDVIFRISDDFQILDLNKLQELNLGYITARAMNKTFQAYDRRITNLIKSDLKRAQKTIKADFQKIKEKITLLSDSKLIARYGSNLSDPNTFYKNIIAAGPTAFRALKTSLTEGQYAVMKPEEFDEIAKTLYKQWWNNSSGIRVIRPDKVQFDMISKVDDTAGGTVTKSQQALYEMNAKPRNVYETNIGLGLEELNKNQEVLELIFGKEGIQTTTEILQVMGGKSGIAMDNINLQNMPKALSVESWISRIYSINRGVISPRYVLTEAALQKYRVQSTSMLIDLMSNPETAGIVKKLMTDGVTNLDPFQDRRLQKFFQKSVVNAIILKEIMSEDGEFNPANPESLVSEDSTVGKAIRYPFEPVDMQ